ncbi:TMEM175 family protein [Synoicihabitans lomoniglobus]|uniref:TMEM175 family protein n=1 Tax=Synoicihabitans lomoniglobus TaxID=2909285 RepID=A0AAE9ZZ97_9BACT|nr:DUF1211 domain-containing protein [Opitutaceae bacterium LMO-M01]WED63247.1 TMEM175 family protein [Opitutaceae bacterium LMO-M01]
MFRWRGAGVSRLEGFADAVFAFTLTLLVVALEVPRNYDDLMKVFQDFPAFVATFAMVMWFWTTHYIFFRRYGLEDIWTRFYNAAILLCVVFLAYPLKFIFTSAFAAMFGIGAESNGIQTMAELSQLYIVYGAGLATVCFAYLLLYLHAYRLRKALHLNETEIIITQGSISRILINIAVCLVSIVLAQQERHVVLPGIIYCSLGPLVGINGWWHGTRAVKAFDAGRSRHGKPSTAA